MAEIEWDNSLSIGVKLIDEQHKMLIQRLGDLSRAIKMSQGEVRTATTLDFMIDYTDFHFSTEEKHMMKQNYPGLEHQKQQHAEFKNHLKQLVEDFEEEGPTKALSTSINVFLLKWLIKHIKGVDLKFGEFLNEKGIKLIE
ncbi:MAG: bacteriohemerythrin [Planctomycetota bacterium]|jgi:hemerythrin